MRLLTIMLLLAAGCAPAWQDTASPSFDADGDGHVEGLDCDDDDPLVSPSAAERCNGLDDDCNGLVDDDDPGLIGTPGFEDGDGDGAGAGDPVIACERTDLVSGAGDCNDADADVRPDALEHCDGVDEDCNGEIDDNPTDGTEVWPDLDGDGFGATGAGKVVCDPAGLGVTQGGDCDDLRSEIAPGVPERCNGRDDDCDGDVDDSGGNAAIDAVDWYLDADGDGFGAGSAVTACVQPDGGVADDGDCNDSDPQVGPHRAERCNGIDDNCSGVIDDDAVDGVTWYLDLDNDGWGSPDQPRFGCVIPPGSVDRPGDCNDLERLVHPGQSERCDGRDSDCNGIADVGQSYDITTTPTWFFDGDGDGVGVAEASDIVACLAPASHASSGGDCDDAEPKKAPSFLETCNDGIDNDCDGSAGACGPSGLFTTDETQVFTLTEPAEYTGLRDVGDLDGAPGAELAVWQWNDDAETVVSLFDAAGDGPNDARLLARWALDPTEGELFPPASGEGDFDGDGHNDLMLTVGGGPSAGLWLLNDPLTGGSVADGQRVSSHEMFGSLSEAPPWGLDLVEGPSLQSIDRHLSWLPDVDSDGKDELIGLHFGALDEPTDLVLIHGGTAAVTTLSVGLLYPYPMVQPIRGDLTGDLDGDGAPEAVVGGSRPDTNGGFGPFISVFDGLEALEGRTSDDAIWPLLDPTGIPEYGLVRVAGDLDGDGRDDLAFSGFDITSLTGNELVAVFLALDPVNAGFDGSAALGRLQFAEPAGGGLGGKPRISWVGAYGDMDGDGTSDVWRKMFQGSTPKLERHIGAWKASSDPPSMVARADAGANTIHLDAVALSNPSNAGPRLDLWMLINGNDVHVLRGGTL